MQGFPERCRLWLKIISAEHGADQEIFKNPIVSKLSILQYYTCRTDEINAKYAIR